MRSINKIFFYSPLVLQTLIWPITRPVLIFFLNLKIIGIENIKNLPKGVIFVANHSSELDPIILPASLPFLSKFMPIFYVSKPKTFYENSGWRQFFYGGMFFKIWGAHSTFSGFKDYKISLQSHIEILKTGHSLLIFPEGKKTKTGEVIIENARGGVAFLAEETGLPIVPIKMAGHFNISCADFFLRKKHVSIIFDKVLYKEDVFRDIDSTGEDRYKEASRFLLRRINDLKF